MKKYITFIFLPLIIGMALYLVRDKSIKAEVIFSQTREISDDKEWNNRWEGDEKNRMEQYYGTYQIVQFCTNIYYNNRKYDVLPEQEADMLIGQNIVITEDLFVTYDSERCLGTREGRMAFPGNYTIKEFSIENPEYQWESGSFQEVFLQVQSEAPFEIKQYYGKINGKFAIQTADSIRRHTYYTLDGENRMILFSGLSEQYFILEKLEEEPERKEVVQPSWEEKEHILQEFYGNYMVTEFLPTKYYPALDSGGYVRLPQEEADMMVGKVILAVRDECVVYDNFRLPNSEITRRAEDDYWVKEVRVEDVDYHLERKMRDEIYGLRDDMLREELLQDEYMEVSVYPGYDGEERILPQFYLLNDGRVMFYSMGEYFLLEKESDQNQAGYYIE